MSDPFYFCLRNACFPIVWVSSRPTILHRERAARPGPHIIAANHLSPYDVPCLMYASPRHLDFLSNTEVFSHPFVAWLFGSMNAFPLDRHHPDLPTVRTALGRLARGRAVSMFPEGQFRPLEKSLLCGGRFKPGVAGLSRLSGAPVIPCVILNTDAFRRVRSWLPVRGVRWGANFGEPLLPRTDLPERECSRDLVARMRVAYRSLYLELCDAMRLPPLDEAVRSRPVHEAHDPA